MTDDAPGPVIGLLGSLDAELLPLAGALAGPRDEHRAGMVARVGRLDGIAVALVATGIGTISAAVAATLLCDAFEVGALALTGVAGGVDPGLEVGDLVVATRVVDADYGRATDGGRILYRPGAVPLPGVAPGDPAFRLDPVLERSVRERLATLELPAAVTRPDGAPRVPAVRLGTIATTDAFIASERVRDAIGRETGALAVEMEGASVAAVAERFGVPWLVVRAVSDRAGTDSGLDFSAFLPIAAGHAATLLRALLPALAEVARRRRGGDLLDLAPSQVPSGAVEPSRLVAEGRAE